MRAFHDDITAKEILDIRNAEQRTEVIKHVGLEKVLDELNPTVIDEYKGVSFKTGKEVHYKLLDFEMERTNLRVVIWEDHTTHKRGPILVPRDTRIKTCFDALAWSFFFDDTEEYVREMQYES